MSLEERIAALTDTVAALNETMQVMVSKAKSAAGAAGDTAGETTKPATRGKGKAKPKEDEGSSDEGNSDDGVDVDSLKGEIRAWMNEFGKDNAEYEARGEALQAALKKLGVEKVGDVPADQLPRVVTWLEKKKAEGKLAKPADDDDL